MASVVAALGDTIPSTVVNKKLPTTKPKAKSGNVLEDVALKPTTLRRSTRFRAKADEHTLEKIARMAAKKNLEPGTSFTNFTDSQVISNLGRVGINLGHTDDIAKASIVSIKNLEIDRMVVQANQKKGNLKSNKLQFESDDERDDRPDAVLGHICGSLNENLQDQVSDHIFDLSLVCRKKKSSTAKNPKNGRLPNKPKTPSKIVIK
jgi:hypothetical protein